MQLKLTKPELEQYVAERVRTGEFPTPEAVVEDALTRMMDENVDLTDSDVDAILRSEAQIDNGDCIDFESFASQMRRKFGKG